MRETAVKVPGEEARDFLRKALLDQARTAAYAALRLTALLDNDLPAHRRIVAKWFRVQVPDDATTDDLHEIVMSEMVSQEDELLRLREQPFGDGSEGS